MEFEEAIKSVAAKVADLKDSIETEEATKTAFIMPFIGIFVAPASASMLSRREPSSARIFDTASLLRLK